MSMYNEIKNLFINKAVTAETYKDNVSFAIMRVSEIIKFMEHFQLEAIKLTAKARILLKERRHRIFLVGALPKRHYGKYFDKYLKEELIILEKEIAATKLKSQEEINKIMKSEPNI